MNIIENVQLNAHSTMRLGGTARYCSDINDWHEIPEALSWAAEKGVPVLMIGDGSNIIWRDEGFDGLLLVNKIKRFEILRQDDHDLYITLGAGENWDEMVARTVQLGYSGIEQLSLIPGTTGATPVQNVGAYGREIADALVSIEAYDTSEQKLVTLAPEDCAFGYRTSRFKTNDKGRFFITSITLHLVRANPLPPFYASLQSYLSEHSITEFTPQVIRDAVIAIRTSKLPDPAKIANNGSFFANPIVSNEQLTQIRESYPQIKYWTNDDGSHKLSAAWLIEEAGFKDYHDPETGMGTWPAQPLVLVNENADTTAELLLFKEKVVKKVYTMFGVQLQQEPELLPDL